MRRFGVDIDELMLAAYGAARDRAELDAFLSLFARAFKAHICGLRVHDEGYRTLTSHYFASIGLSVRDWEAFDIDCAHLNPWRHQGRADLQRDGVGHSGTIMTHEELRRSPFYREYLRHVDIDFGMGISLWSSDSGPTAVLSFNRVAAAGAFDDDDVGLARRLMPHLRSAYAIMRELSWRDVRAAGLAGAIERLAAGVIQLDANGRCVFVNAAAEKMLSAADPIWLGVDRSPRLRDLRLNQRLRAAIASAAAGSLATPVRLYVCDDHRRVRYAIVVTMLSGDLLTRASPESPRICVFVQAPTVTARNTTSVLSDAYGFTAAESVLAGLLVDGHDLGESAGLLGKSMPTLRSQVRSMLDKTGTRRQAELVAALAFVLRDA